VLVTNNGTASVTVNEDAKSAFVSHSMRPGSAPSSGIRRRIGPKATAA